MNKLPIDIFTKAVDEQFQLMATSGVLVRLNANVDELYAKYLESYPEGTNNIFRERTEHDCNCCKSFIRRIGNVVSITPKGLMSVWDVKVDGYYQDIADALAAEVRKYPINSYYLTTEKQAGSKPNLDNHDSKIKWTHFYTEVPRQFIKSSTDIGPTTSMLNGTKDVFERGLKSFTIDAAETVLELIKSNTLYKGSEFKWAVELFIKHKTAYDKLNDADKVLYIWSKAFQEGEKVRFRSSVIGTLVEDLSDGKDLEASVASYESKVAPTNYKRPTALVTPKMIETAQAKVKELGIEDSLHRRYANETDITVNNVLYSAVHEKPTNAFDVLTTEAQAKPGKKDLSKVEEIDIDKFIENVLPSAKKVEVFVKNSMQNNLMSLISPIDANAPNLFKWDNLFSWTYNGDITDSIRERVKKFGGAVDGALRVSLSWSNPDDLDLSIIEPNKNTIYYHSKHSTTSGTLDLDMNGLDKKSETEPVENIIYSNKSRMPKGKYVVKVNNYSKRSSENQGFALQVEFDGKIHEFSYKDNNVKALTVFNIEFDGQSFKITDVNSGLESSAQSKEIWNINTEQFVPVKMIMNSPNHWNDTQIGHKHVFFLLEGCNNPTDSRGFYNEFLRSDLEEHRKVFELLGGKLKAQHSDDQLSGVGFSTTKQDSVLVRVQGKTNRSMIVKF